MCINNSLNYQMAAYQSKKRKISTAINLFNDKQRHQEMLLIWMSIYSFE
jgi:hypothetical protein